MLQTTLKWRLYFFLANPTSREGPKSMLLGISGWSSRGEEWTWTDLERAGSMQSPNSKFSGRILVHPTALGKRQLSITAPPLA